MLTNPVNSLGQIAGILDSLGLVGRVVEAVPYLAGGVAIGLAGKFLVPETQKGIKIATTISALGLVGIGVYKIIKK